jgi:DNA-binding transcriptional LysR family regulator
MHMQWDDAQLFLAVAEAGSLSAAARRLHITQPTVSRRVALLEAQLGEAVFVRTADGARLTSFGERLLEPARRMAEWAGELDRAAERAETTPRGSVRVTAPPGIAYDFLAPFAAWMST